MYRRAAIRWGMCADGEALATAETLKHSVFIFLTAVNTHQTRSNMKEAAAYRFSGQGRICRSKGRQKAGHIAFTVRKCLTPFLLVIQTTPLTME